MEDLQSSALPLGYAATAFNSRGQTLYAPGEAVKTDAPPWGDGGAMERETGFEPATSTLARLHSTTELLPPNGFLPVVGRRWEYATQLKGRQDPIVQKFPHFFRSGTRDSWAEGALEGGVPDRGWRWRSSRMPSAMA